MKRSIFSFCILAVLAVNTVCNAVEEKRNTNLSQMYITARGDIQEIKINKNKIAINGILKKQGEVSQFNLMLFPGDIISIKAKTGEGLKGGILGYINYVDEDKKTTKLTTNKENWICDRAVPGEEKKKDSALIKEEGAQWIWGATYQQETICKVQIPCRGGSEVTSQTKEETKTNLRGDKPKQPKIDNFPKILEIKNNKIEDDKPTSTTTIQKSQETKVIKKKPQSTLSAPTAHHHSSPVVRRSEVYSGNNQKYFCIEKNGFIPYREEKSIHYCLKKVEHNHCHSLKSMENCLAFIKSDIKKDERPYNLPK